MAEILVIDDDADIQRLLQFALKRVGHTVTISSDGEQGLAQANVVEPDLRFETEIEEAESRARQGRLGLWGGPPPTVPTAASSPAPTSTGPAAGPTEPVETATSPPASPTAAETTEADSTAATEEPTAEASPTPTETTGSEPTATPADSSGLQGPQ